MKRAAKDIDWMTIRDCTCYGAGCIESDYAPGTFSPCCGCNPDWTRIPEPRAPQWDRTTPPANILAIVNAELRLSASAPSPEDKGSDTALREDERRLVDAWSVSRDDLRQAGRIDLELCVLDMLKIIARLSASPVENGQ